MYIHIFLYATLLLPGRPDDSLLNNGENGNVLSLCDLMYNVACGCTWHLCVRHWVWWGVSGRYLN